MGSALTVYALSPAQKYYPIYWDYIQRPRYQTGAPVQLYPVLGPYQISLDVAEGPYKIG